MKHFFIFLLMGFVLYLPDLAFGQAKNIDIDCSAKPSTPDPTWTIVSNQQDGSYLFNPAEAGKKIISFESKTAPITGEQMIKKLNGKGLNACVLDYLMAHKELFPEEWKTKNVVFAGTVFADAHGNKLIKFAYWWDNNQQVGFTYLNEAYDDRVAAVK